MVKRVYLRRSIEISINPSRPFNFDGTFNKPSHYPDGLSEWEKGRYWQTIRVDKRIFGLRVEDKGTLNKPKISLSIFYKGRITPETVEKIRREVVWRFDLDADLEEFNAIARSDRRFARVFKRWKGMRNSSAHDLYGILMVSIFLQNATVRRTVQMTKVMLENFGTEAVFDGKRIFAMWVPDDLVGVPEKRLRDLKIGYRARFIKRLSSEFSDGKIDEGRMRGYSSRQVKEELMKLYGVGPETARILLFEVLHDYGAFDHISPWQQKIYSRLFYDKEMVPAAKISGDIKRAYGKYSMLAVHYIWEDVFWRRKTQHIDWLEKEIRL